MDIPRVVLGGTNSRAGKTVISIGLMRALRNRGYEVQPFKTGPDFIDPSYHNFATGRRSRNLDGFMMKDGDIKECFTRNSQGADIAVVEGAMGLFDSHDALDERGSTAHVSKVLSAPTLVIANVERIARSAAAITMGFKVFDEGVNVKGVILNRLGSERHIQKAKLAVEQLADMKVFGALPRDPKVGIPERHLGLVPAYEREEIDELFEYLSAFVEKHVDVDGIIELAMDAGSMEEIEQNELFKDDDLGVTIGIVRDRAFNFYYEDTIDAFAAKAHVLYIDSMKDRRLPDVDALYIGGGFPEVFAEKLEENTSLKGEILDFCESGNPVYAECGGLMYLGEKMTTGGREYDMVGFLPIKTQMKSTFQALGYTVSRVEKDNPISDSGATLVGHEFHHSTIKLLGDVEYVCEMIRGRGIDGKRDGILRGNTLASYSHLHVLSYPKMIENFLAKATG
ncbi:MAG: cobyrinate a,c-diamide synthase [Candidatus Hydrothermarchaeales archaeon]